ncbi:MAG: Sua5/YciO/YrdC/YwlC family protein [Cellvibrionaceae bacterium]|nr:Sua5/YciO/YrdC/YwlC family protein [Cellvibrionaceae bacterium]
MSIYLASPGITLAAKTLHRGGVIAYPTEGVWGLGCDPFNPHAVANILALKRRDPRKGLILIAATIEQLHPYLSRVSPTQMRQLENTWPGPYTWLVPNNHLIPPWISGEFSSVALRVSKHPLVQALCQRFGGPIVSTSANPQGMPAARAAWQVRRYFKGDKRLTRIVQGQVGRRSRPSEIRDLLSGQLIRPGH